VRGYPAKTKRKKTKKEKKEEKRKGMSSFVPKTGAAATDAVARTLLWRGIQVLALGAGGQENKGVVGRSGEQCNARSSRWQDRVMWWTTGKGE
jgi:hypothetical protein